jgi:hypothetical protein
MSFVHQRPDQRPIPTTPGTVPGSRSGAAETASTLQQAGIPPLVLGLASAAQLHVGGPQVSVFYTFAVAGRIWGSTLSAAISSNPSFTTNTANTYAELRTGSGIHLGVVELAVAGVGQAANGQSPPLILGVDAAPGETLILDVNNAVNVPGLNQHASAIVYYQLLS